MNNFNFDENSMNKLKDMLNNGELNNVISQISPEMIQNFSSKMNNSNQAVPNDPSNMNENKNNIKFQNTSQSTSSENTTPNFNNIDMNTILKMKSIMEKLNNNNNPRSNLLYSLKPFLRDSRKEKIEQYANLLNFAQIAELLRNDNKEKPDV